MEINRATGRVPERVSTGLKPSNGVGAAGVDSGLDPRRGLKRPDEEGVWLSGTDTAGGVVMSES